LVLRTFSLVRMFLHAKIVQGVMKGTTSFHFPSLLAAEVLARGQWEGEEIKTS